MVNYEFKKTREIEKPLFSFTALRTYQDANKQIIEEVGSCYNLISVWGGRGNQGFCDYPLSQLSGTLLVDYKLKERITIWISTTQPLTFTRMTAWTFQTYYL